ncbi:MAG TPA: pirin family protein [Rhizomicrobium sp.]|jgi:redox-sensitive bicupin YhaK (pirin superfamily)|nr:pirin family protein [Rhizomicrobium sp.]
MIIVRKSEDRGETSIDWLKSRHSFSFGDYYDPANESFGALRVINEDWIAGGAGFPPHPHRDMEIVTYILEGAIAHRDSAGGGGTIRPGEIQRMSAGTGIVHSEFNASPTQACHLLQIWIVPSRRGIQPGYEQKAIDQAAVRNHFARIAAPDPRENEVRLVQDAEIWAARLDADVETIHPLEQGRKAWLQVARGEVVLGGETLKAGDAAAVTDQAEITVRSRAPSEVLLFDLA